MEGVMKVLKKLKIELLYDPPLGVYLKECTYNKDTGTPMFR
jgi:hypothetical protein